MAARPTLRRVTDLALARATLEAFVPPNAHQTGERERMLAFIDAHPNDAHLRSCLEGHLTASCLLLDHAGERALLTHHRKLRRWLQLGGHCDGDANLAHAAWCEATEESGIDGIEIEPEPVDLDIHVIPARPGEPEHLHLDSRFIARAPAGAREVVSSESIELAWVSPADLARLETDNSVRRLFEIAFGPR
ncbi:MAG: NUDIX hydrolase [Planctomycetes bacterium]|nr:NUDIX hydrolase [Planctomycetota bacterium]